MVRTLTLALLALALTVSAADTLGAWKLNTAKSKYTGTPAPKEMTVTYTKQGTGWTYSAKGTSASGEAINRSYTFVKDGEEAKTTGFPNWDGIVLKNSTTNTTTYTLMRQGKAVGSGTRTLSADGKTMTLHASTTLPDGKKTTTHGVYEKQ